MRTFLFFLLTMTLVSGQPLNACSLIACPASVSPATATRAIKPTPLDFKKQDVPKKIPPVVKRDTVPNLRPLIHQLMRHWELNNSANKVMPWVYVTGTEIIVADFEDAVTSLDLADEFLQEAMENVLLKSNDSFKADPSLIEATLAIDEAEYTIRFLLELAIREL